jgi:hypothetical protein
MNRNESCRIGYQIRDDETGYDEHLWVETHEKLFGESVESDLAGLSEIPEGHAVMKTASDIVRESRKNPDA